MFHITKSATIFSGIYVFSGINNYFPPAYYYTGGDFINNCSCRPNCTGIAVLVSIVIGIIAGFLTASAILTVPTPFLWALFAIATVAIGTLLGLTVTSAPRAIRCICNVLPLLLTGILGTITASVILLIIDIAAASTLGAIITGLMFFFFALLLTSTACLIRCIADCDDD